MSIETSTFVNDGSGKNLRINDAISLARNGWCGWAEGGHQTEGMSDVGEADRSKAGNEK
jgi:hypothetical protein